MTLAFGAQSIDYLMQLVDKVDKVTLLLLVLSHAESNLTAKFTTQVKFPMGL